MVQSLEDVVSIAAGSISCPALAVGDDQTRIINAGLASLVPALPDLGILHRVFVGFLLLGVVVALVAVLLVVEPRLIPLYFVVGLLVLVGIEGAELQASDVGGQGGDDPGVDVVLEAESLGQSHRVVLRPYQNGGVAALLELDHHFHLFCLIADQLVPAMWRLFRLFGEEMLVIQQLLVQLRVVGGVPLVSTVVPAHGLIQIITVLLCQIPQSNTIIVSNMVVIIVRNRVVIL